jgi:ubiquinone/menaquinone biosynthesis C-methylase UbiE
VTITGTYTDAIFNVTSFARAKEIVLTSEEDGLSSDERWQRETDYILTLLPESLELNSGSLVLDYGCGVGRISKALIDKYSCTVVGVDISASMLALAKEYVGSDKFFIAPPEQLNLSLFHHKFDVALSVWVLQHCQNPAEDIARIRRALTANGIFLVVNERRNFLPVISDGQFKWLDTGLNIQKLLGVPQKKGALSPEAASKRTIDRTFWAVYQGN